MSDEINRDELKEALEARFEERSNEWFGAFFFRVKHFFESHGFQVIDNDYLEDAEILVFDIDGERIAFERDTKRVNLSKETRFLYMGREYQITRIGIDVFDGDLEISAETNEWSENE